jgi:hypothetical protein
LAAPYWPSFGTLLIISHLTLSDCMSRGREGERQSMSAERQMAIRTFFYAFLTSLLIAIGSSVGSSADTDSASPQPHEEGVAQFLVTKSNDGYVLLLPPGLLKQLPETSEYQVTLTAKDGQAAAVSGVGKKNGDNFLNLITGSVFRLPSIDRNSLQALDVKMVSAAAESSCKGDCPRGRDLDCYNPPYDCSICWCLVKKLPPPE